MSNRWWDEPRRGYKDEVSKAINRLRFKSRIWWNSWDTGESLYQETIDMAMKVREMAGLTPYSRDFLENGLQYFPSILSHDYYVAYREFYSFCWGDW